jgi:anti-sigma factor (TIGR02949 family)
MSDETRAIDCRTAVRQLWDYLDSELDDARMDEVRHHLETCSHCLPHAQFGTRFLKALNTVRDRQVMPSAVRSQVIAALGDAGFSLE